FIRVVCVAGGLIGGGVSALVAVARQWDRPDQASSFFRLLAILMVSVVAVNVLLGVYVTHKIAGPLERLRRGMAQVARGNLEEEILLRRGDLLGEFTHGFNQMVEALRHLIYRDHRFVIEANELLTQCQQRISSDQGRGAGDREELQQLVKEAKSRLSIINDHFMKGR
ncbi:MAG: HAMP domain-containing protein, partial [bacterium]